MHIPSSIIKYKKILIVFFVLYGVLVHILLLNILLRTDVLHLVGCEFGGQSREITKYYRTMLSFHLMADGNIPDRSIFLLGDSITQGLCTSCIAGNAINYGIGNDTSLGVLNRIQQYKSMTKAQAIVLAIGINDLSRRGDTEIVANYQKIISALPDVKIVISAILPVDERAVRNTQLSNARIKNLNSNIQSLCKLYRRCLYFDSTMQMTGEDGSLNQELHIGDGVHLNAAGYNYWIGDIRQALKGLE